MNYQKTLYLIIIILSLSACEPHGKIASEQSLDADELSLAKKLFVAKGCASCHQFSPMVQASGQVGPPLDDYYRRSYIAGVLPNTYENLSKWLLEPKQYHTNSAMPATKLTPDEAKLLSYYLLDTRNGG